MAQLTEAYLKNLIKKVIKEEGPYSHTESETLPFTTQHNVGGVVSELQGLIRAYEVGRLNKRDDMLASLNLLLKKLENLSSPAYEQTPITSQYRKQTRGY
jgi:hypothetical protein